MAMDESVFYFDIQPFIDGMKKLEESVFGGVDNMIKSFQAMVGEMDVVTKKFDEVDSIARKFREREEEQSRGPEAVARKVREKEEREQSRGPEAVARKVREKEEREQSRGPEAVARKVREKENDHGLGNITRKFKEMENGIAKLGNGIAKGIQSGVQKAMLSIELLKKGALEIKNVFMKYMPEVGQSLNFVKDTFFVNFLNPIRKELQPILLKMMNWVTDHRALFVQWGNVVVNVFRTVVVVAKNLWGIFKTVIDALANSFQKALGTNFHSFDELLNVLSFKIAAIIIYMNLLVERMDVDLSKAFDWILGQGKTIIESFTGLLKNLADSAVNTGAIQASLGLLQAAVVGFTSVFTDGFIANLGKLIGLIFNPNLKGDNMTTALNSIKNLINVVVPTVNGALSSLTEGFVSGASEIMTPLRGIIDNIGEMMLGINTEEGQKAFRALGNIGGTALQGVVNLMASLSSSFSTLSTSIFNKNENGKSMGTVMDGLAEAFNKIKNLGNTIFASLFDGLVSALNNVMSPVDSIVQNFKSLLELIDGDEGGKIGTAFKILGRILGSTLLFVMTNISTAFDSVITGVKTVMQIIKTMGSDEMSLPEKAFDIAKTIAGNSKDWGTRTKEAFGNVFKSYADIGLEFTDDEKKSYREVVPVNDAIITKTGRVIKTAPEDTIIAARNLFGGKENKTSTTNQPITVNFGDTYITVTEGNAERAGKNYGQAFAESFRQSIATQMLREGY